MRLLSCAAYDAEDTFALDPQIYLRNRVLVFLPPAVIVKGKELEVLRIVRKFYFEGATSLVPFHSLQLLHWGPSERQARPGGSLTTLWKWQYRISLRARRTFCIVVIVTSYSGVKQIDWLFSSFIVWTGSPYDVRSDHSGRCGLASWSNLAFRWTFQPPAPLCQVRLPSWE